MSNGKNINVLKNTYHLESVKLLLDLLSKEGGQTIACGNLTSSVILPWWPGVVELYARAETNIAGCKTLRRAWQAFRITIGEARQRQEIFFSFYIDRISLSVCGPWRLFIGGRGWSTGVGTVVKVGDLREIEIWGLCINRSCDWRSLA